MYSLPQRRTSRGFTLLEVVIALAILAISLGVLLESQVSSLANADRARGLTIAALLARAKLIDVEQHLFDEGFVEGVVEEEGDFREEGHGDIRWKYRVSEVELDLSSLSSLCGAFAAGGDDTGQTQMADCESLVSGVSGPLTGLTEEVGRSLRAVEITVTWPSGRYTENMSVRAFVTRDDFTMAPAGFDLQALPGGGAGVGGAGMGGGLPPQLQQGLGQ